MSAIRTALAQIRGIAIACAAVNVLLPLGLYVYGELFTEGYWTMFWGENNAITWWSSVQLLVVAAAAWANFAVASAASPARRPWIWAVFAAGFVFLALDERFEIHERVRDGWLLPSGSFDGIPFVRPGDVGLYAYLLAGVALATFLLAELWRVRRAFWLFAAGVALAAVFTVVDALPREIELRLPYFLTSVFEEGGELWSQWLFLAAFLVVLDGRLRRGGEAA